MSKKNKTKQFILDTGCELFSKYGFRGTTVRMICRATDTNVASIRYYFGSKKGLYLTVFKYLFTDDDKKFCQSVFPEITNKQEWEDAIYQWAYNLLEIITSKDDKQRYKSGLYLWERTVPSEELDIIFEQFITPYTEYLGNLLRLGLPKDCSITDQKIWITSTYSQVINYASTTDAWDRILIPSDIRREDWLEKVAKHVVSSITSRLQFLG